MNHRPGRTIAIRSFLFGSPKSKIARSFAPHFRGSSSGMGMAEVVISMAILGITMSVFARTLVFFKQLEVDASRSIKATEIAEEYIRKLYAAPYTDVDTLCNERLTAGQCTVDAETGKLVKSSSVDSLPTSSTYKLSTPIKSRTSAADSFCVSLSPTESCSWYVGSDIRQIPLKVTWLSNGRVDSKIYYIRRGSW